MKFQVLSPSKEEGIEVLPNWADSLLLSVGTEYQKAKVSIQSNLHSWSFFWLLKILDQRFPVKINWMLIYFLMNLLGIVSLEEFQWMSHRHPKLNMQEKTLDFNPRNPFFLCPHSVKSTSLHVVLRSKPWVHS